MRDLPIHTKGADIASAAAIDLGAATGDFVDVTGTTTITSLGTVRAGREVVVRFTGILTLTHNATSLILPAAGNITTAANDCAIFRSLGSGNWQCVSYSAGAGGAEVTLAGAETLTNKTLTSPNITTGIFPTTDDGAPLGSTTKNWSDLFLASGAVINYANDNASITHSSGVITVDTGDLRVTTAGTNSASAVTVGGTQTLTNKTLTAPVATAAVITPAVTTISGDGAITIASGIVRLTKGSAAAITLAAPSSNDGVCITIMSTTDFQHVVTVTGGMWDGTATTNTTVTFPAVAGGAVTLMASGTDWYVLNNQGTTIAP
jgi:hypothetical protein